MIWGTLLAAFYAAILAFSYLGFNLSAITAPFADEVAYMAIGLSGGQSLSNGGATGITYGVASVLTDNENAIGKIGQFMWYLVAISVTGATLFVVTRKHWLTILLTALFILLDRGTWVGAWPKVGVAMYAMTVAYVILAGLSGSLSKPQTSVEQIAYSAHGVIILLIGGLFRPELFWGLPLLAALILFEALKFCIGLRFAAIGIALCALALFFMAANSDSDGRAWIAFQQHYTLGLRDRDSRYQKIDPWIDAERIQIFKEEFPRTSSITDVLQDYPEKFFTHVFHNLRHIPWVVMRKTFLAMILFTFVLYRYRGNIRTISTSTVSPAISMAAVYFLSSAVIYPRGHYANTLYAALMIGALYLVFWSRNSGKLDSREIELNPPYVSFAAGNDGAVSPALFVIVLVLLFNKQHDLDLYLSGMKGDKGYVNIRLPW